MQNHLSELSKLLQLIRNNCNNNNNSIKLLAYVYLSLCDLWD